MNVGGNRELTRNRGRVRIRKRSDGRKKERKRMVKRELKNSKQWQLRVSKSE